MKIRDAGEGDLQDIIRIYNAIATRMATAQLELVTIENRWTG